MRLERGLENKSQSAAVLGALLVWPPTSVGSGAAGWAMQAVRRALPPAAGSLFGVPWEQEHHSSFQAAGVTLCTI